MNITLGHSKGYGLAGLLIASAVTLSACKPSAPPPAADQAIRPARIVLVGATQREVTHQFVGRIEAAQSIDVTFEVGGPLQKLPVQEGQTVTKGTLIAALDPTDLNLAVREAKVQLKLARQDLDRKQRMLALRSIAPSAVDGAVANHELQQVRLEQARESLADSRITAPFDAYLAHRYVDNFVNVKAGDKIARLNDLHELLVITSIPDHLLATVSADQLLTSSARFTFAPDRSFPITYRRNRGEADAVAQTYEVAFALPRPEGLNVLPGMTATVDIKLSGTAASQNVTHIPTTALVSHPDTSFFVWQFDPDTQRVRRLDVEVGTPSKLGVPVLKGLKGGELIVASGASQLQDGMEIRALGDITTY